MEDTGGADWRQYEEQQEHEWYLLTHNRNEDKDVSTACVQSNSTSNRSNGSGRDSQGQEKQSAGVQL